MIRLVAKRCHSVLWLWPCASYGPCVNALRGSQQPGWICVSRMGGGASKKSEIDNNKHDDFAEDSDYKSEAPHIQAQLQQAGSVHDVGAVVSQASKKG